MSNIWSRKYALRGAYAPGGGALCGRSVYTQAWGFAHGLNRQFSVRLYRRVL